MLAELLYWLIPYQIFKSVFFRAGLTYLTTYFLINLFIPKIIRLFRQKGITSDFKVAESSSGPYSGATPIMGGIVLIPAIVLSTILWAWLNKYTISLLIIITAFAFIGGIDDIMKVFHKKKVESGVANKRTFADKADGISGKTRLLFEFSITTLVIGGIYYFSNGLENYLLIPGIPIANWHPEIPVIIFIPFIILVIVVGANAVNLTDGLDSLAAVPIITSSVFIAAAAYIAGDAEWSERLRISFITSDIKEITIFAIAIIAACIAFLKFNSPPASIYMGDIGSLGFGASICTMFIFVRTEFYLPIVGWVFVLAAISSIIQRIWFKIALWRKGRSWAEKNRFFYKAPYHHHLQEMMEYREEKHDIRSIWHDCMIRIGLGQISDEDKYKKQDHINNKVIWSHHLRAVSLLVIALIIYFKLR